MTDNISISLGQKFQEVIFTKISYFSKKFYQRGFAGSYVDPLPL